MNYTTCTKFWGFIGKFISGLHIRERKTLFPMLKVYLKYIWLMITIYSLFYNELALKISEEQLSFLPRSVQGGCTQMFPLGPSWDSWFPLSQGLVCCLLVSTKVDTTTMWCDPKAYLVSSSWLETRNLQQLLIHRSCIPRPPADVWNQHQTLHILYFPMHTYLIKFNL